MIKYKDCCFNRLTIIILSFLLILSLISTISFWLEELLNPNISVTIAIWRVYWDVYPAWISVIAAFLNVLCAYTGIQLTYRTREIKKRVFINCIIYEVISLAVMVVHCITSCYIFESVVVSV